MTYVVSLENAVSSAHVIIYQPHYFHILQPLCFYNGANYSFPITVSATMAYNTTEPP